MEHNLVVSVSRSIQKLEEMNVGIDHRGEEMMTHLGQQCNGLTGSNSTPSPGTASIRHTVETASLRDKPGGVSSSTPSRAESRGLPSLSESPVPASQR